MKATNDDSTVYRMRVFFTTNKIFNLTNLFCSYTQAMFFFTIVYHDLWAYLFTFTCIFALCNFLLMNIECEINLLSREITIPQHLLVHLRFVVFVTCLFLIISLRQ